MLNTWFTIGKILNSVWFCIEYWNTGNLGKQLYKVIRKFLSSFTVYSLQYISDVASCNRLDEIQYWWNPCDRDLSNRLNKIQYWRNPCDRNVWMKTSTYETLVTETLVTGLIKYNNDKTLVTETLVTGLIKYNTDETLVTETLVTGLIKYNTDETLVTETFEWKQVLTKPLWLRP